ncbi:hypothetical protein KKD62_00765 [Patescibacteria group bacterium]|nr:hypothetical protein [Patescibacteria group bacterium]MBU1931466.1 hypothetical protein [Patescibacteria group bacterium]
MPENSSQTAQVKLVDQPEKLVKSLEKPKKQTKMASLLMAVFVAGLGILTGYLLSQKTQSGTMPAGIGGSTEKIKKGTIVGLSDAKTFKDEAEGKLVSGGIDGEGSHHLERPGGDSKSVYLTSSAINLNEYLDRQVKVWGETFSAQKAGWLMDVGKLEVLE